MKSAIIATTQLVRCHHSPTKICLESICSSVLDAASLRRLEESVPMLMCNLEKITPPSFFDGMKHLVIHLLYEALTAGLVFYRWMYRFERFLVELKKKVTNKAHVEASICQAYLQQEISTFSSFYFEREIITRRKRPARNDDICEDLYENVVFIFNYSGRGKGVATNRYIVGGKLQIAHTYILMNYPEILPFYHEFRAEFSALPDSEIDVMVDSNFVPWYKYQINSRGIVDPLLVSLSWGPGAYAKVWRSYVINGYTYNTVAYGQGQPTVNNGLCVTTIGYDNSETNFFGVLHEILKFEMPSGGKNLTCVLFRCKWFDPTRGVRKNSKYNMIDVNHSRVYRKNEPFILVQQAAQV
ncbi:unnamed protein product [Cuscuta europaea]|uniref:DUF4218 domain-containing protein n=1 Tax=Cuscuta europaea TaxID=41803 RepID=A0A9P0Z9L0_CUSEU|nr:unnamed protein product [Cuscuta europaea]